MQSVDEASDRVGDLDAAAERNSGGAVLAIIIGVLAAILTATLTYWLLSRRIGMLASDLAGMSQRAEGNEWKLKRLSTDVDVLKLSAPPAAPATSPSRQGLAGAFAASPAPPAGTADDRYASWERPPAPPPPPVSRAPQLLDELRGAVVSLLGSPGMKSSEYDATLARFGSLYGVNIPPDGLSGQLVELGQDTARRLVAVRLAGEDTVAILPSSRYVKDFAMTYKESLEAGSDVKLLFSCEADGSGQLKLGQLAVGKVDGALGLSGLSKGQLIGFVR